MAESGTSRAWCVPFSTTALIVVGAILGGLLAAFFVARSALLNDPVDVVGVPLLLGYSERLEQWSFYTFILSSVLLAGILSRFLRAERVPASVVVPAGAIAMLVPPCLPAWSCWPLTVPAATLCGLLAFLAGSLWVERRWGSGDRAGRALFAGLLLWSLGFPTVPVTWLGDWRYASAGVLMALSLRWLYPKLPSTLRGNHVDWRHAAAALMVTCGALIDNERELRFAAIGALGFVLGQRARLKRRGTPVLGGIPWLAYVAVLWMSFTLVDHWSVLGLVKTVLTVAGGAGGAAVLSLAIPARLQRRIWAFPSTIRWGREFLLAAIGGLVLTNVSRPWSGSLIVGAAIAIVFAPARPRQARRKSWAFALAGVLMLAFLPRPPRTTLDPFHDGQILSAVWEFESGRPLFTEVFPLRSYEFFLIWLSRRFLDPSLANFFIVKQLLDALPIAGACLLSFFWTRSLAWSFATALAAATFAAMSSRMGLSFLGCALGVAVFRSRSPLHLAWLAGGGWLAALLGFDVLVPFVGPCLLTVLILGPPGRSESGWGQKLGWTALLLIATVAPFLAFLALWQGEKAVGAYGWLLVDNARNLPAFYGLPLPWDDLGERDLMTSSLMVVGTWAAAGASAWPFLSGSRRRIWLFLLVGYVLIAHRGLGRSDPAHLSILILLNRVLSALALFEGLRFLARRGLRSPFTDHRVVAYAMMVAACWWLPPGEINPCDVRRWLREVPEQLDREPPLSPFILARVGPRDDLWEMEDAMMNYRYRRHNPTRHAIAYGISSPAEQRVAVAAFRARPPRLIAWRYLSGSNGIPNPLRYYVISQHLYRHFRPLVHDGAAFLEPAPPGWPGQVDLAPDFDQPLPLGQLALRWGRDRIPEVLEDVSGRQAVGPWMNPDRVGYSLKNASATLVRTWEMRTPIDSRVMNYLRLDLACQELAGSPSPEVEASLEFAPIGRGYDEAAPVSFAVIADGVVRPYLIPIGCSSAWGWRPGIDRIRLSVTAVTRLSTRRFECWDVDEMGPKPAARSWPSFHIQ